MMAFYLIVCQVLLINLLIAMFKSVLECLRKERKKEERKKKKSGKG